MIRAFFRDSAIYMIPTILSNGISFLLIPLYTRVLSPSDYGALDMVTVFGSLVALTVALEVSQGVARFYQEEKTEEGKSVLASTAIWFTAFTFTLFCIVALVFAPELSQVVIGAPGLEDFFRLSIVYIYANGFLYLLKNQFRWELRSKDYSIVSLVHSIATTVFSVLLVIVFHYGLYGLMVGMIIGTVSGSILSLYYLRTTFQLRFNLAKLKTMLFFSIPLVPSGIAVFVSMYVDRLLLNHFFSLQEVGLYGIGFRLASVSTLAIVGFQGSMTPLVYKHYKDPQTPGQLATIFRVFLAFVLLIFLGLTLFADNILWLLTTPSYYTASQVVVFLVPAVLLSQMYIFAPGIGIAKKTHLIIWINIGGAILNFFFNWLLIPPLGIIGAGIATLMGYICVFSAYMIFSQKLYYVPHNWKTIASVVAVAVILVIVGLNMHFGNYINIIIRSGLILLMLCAFLLLGLLKRDEIMHALSFLPSGRSNIK